MKSSSSARRRVTKDLRIVVVASLLSGLLSSFAAFAQTGTPPSNEPAPAPAPTSPPATTQPPSAKSLEDWRASMARVPLPKKGCFTSSYPSTEWQEVPCTTLPAVPYPPARGLRPVTVGNGNDVSAEATTGHISTAVGSFDSVTGVTSESDSAQGANNYTLQLNTNYFTTSTCSGAANPSACRGWQQFIYSYNFTNGAAGVQYWLLYYGTTNCPTGWTSYQAYGYDYCWTNGNGVYVPGFEQPITNLANLSVMAEAVSGGMDTIIFSTGSGLYAAQNEDSVVNLAQGWTAAEFNIVGACCSSQANFNSGSTIVVRTSVDYGSPSAPSCSGEGFTAETNNLSFANAATAQPGTWPAVVFTESSAGGAASACDSATSVGSSKLADRTSTHDFNGDGYSDIAWRDSKGDNAVWLMNGSTVLSGAGLGTIAAAWSIVGQRDFNGDGMADLLWHDSSGDLAIWFMNGTTVTSGVGLGTVTPVWSIVGTGDFNGDGKGDILWRDTSGDIAIWLMNGSTVSFSTGLGSLSTTWSVVGTGDFNGDGMSDILWQDTSGDIAIWFMNGTTVSSGVGLGTIAPPWTIVATGDFNGDGMTDILWRNTSTGAIAVWLMNGSSILSSAGLGSIATTWSVVETGDFNGDGKSDILWHDTSGDVAIWFMNGTTVSSGVGLGTIATPWIIQGAGAD